MNSCFTLHKGLSVSHYSHQTLYDQRHVQGLSTQHTWEPLAGNCMAVYCPTACTRKVLCGADVAMRRNPATELVNCKAVLVFDCSKFLTLYRHMTCYQPNFAKGGKPAHKTESGSPGSI